MVVPVTMSKKNELVEFGDDVRMRRKALNLTMEQLAERAELTPNYISTIENGQRDPSLSTIEQLAHGLGVPAGALLGKVAVLSPQAHEMATLFDQVPPQLQAGILMILRTTSKP